MVNCCKYIEKGKRPRFCVQIEPASCKGKKVNNQIRLVPEIVTSNDKIFNDKFVYGVTFLPMGVIICVKNELNISNETS